MADEWKGGDAVSPKSVLWQSISSLAEISWFKKRD
jgi:hypothetical protein